VCVDKSSCVLRQQPVYLHIFSIR